VAGTAPASPAAAGSSENLPVCRINAHNDHYRAPSQVVDVNDRDASGARPRAAMPGMSSRAGRPAVRPVRIGLRDDGGMTGLRSGMLIVLVIAAAALSACGSSSTSSTASTATSSATSTTAGSGSGLAAAKQKCLDATKKIQNASARSTAEQACDQITTSNANVSSALSKAKQTCLTAAAKIPIASLKQSAEAQCNKIAAQ
jgi:hypothetical protein